MSHRKLARKLLQKADQDLTTLKKLISDDEVADEILGFHAQQAAEKILKAILAFCKIDFPYTHRLADLIDILHDNGVRIPDELDDVRYLTPFAVAFRYEFIEEDDDPLEREEILLLLDKLKMWAIEIVSDE